MKLEAHNYQNRATDFAYEHQASYCALDMGLGKTLISINWIRKILNEVNAVLVVAPIRPITSTWPKELKKWAPELSYTLLHGEDKDLQIKLKRNVYLINYDGLRWLLNSLKVIFKKTGQIPFRAIVIDEGTKISSANTQRHKIMNILADAAPKYKLILSGTPQPNSELDLWAQYFFLDKGERLEYTYASYKARYFNQYEIVDKVTKQGKKVKTAKRIYGHVIKEGCDTIIREKIGDITFRLDSEDYVKIPPQIENEILIDLPPKLQATYKKLEKEFFMELDETEFEALNSASLNNKLRQFVQGGIYTEGPKYKVEGERPYQVVHKEKLKVLEELVEDANGQGILCAIQYRFELDMIHERYPDAPIIAGGISPKESNRLIDLWNEGKIPLLICHPNSISEGVNLQTGSHLIVWYGLTWSLYQYLQFNARLHRQGQLETVIVHHLIIANTIDEYIMKALKNKFKGQRELLDYLKGLR